MTFFRKKPVTIEAIQWTGENITAVSSFVGWSNIAYCARYGLTIYTLEGAHYASVGDWIIKGVKEEFYPCKPDFFALTYDEVETPT